MKPSNPLPQEVAYVENEIPTPSVYLTFQEKLNVINKPHLAAKYKIKATTVIYIAMRIIFDFFIKI